MKANVGPNVRPGAWANAWPYMWVLLALLPGAWALVLRQPVPLDELRYLAVGWEMWTRGDLLVPHLNGLPYSDKPPLLFWLMHAGWALFGVNAIWPRLIGPAAAVAVAWLTARVARQLWPGADGTARLVPWLLVGSLGVIVNGQMLMFDLPLTAWVLLGAGRIAGFALQPRTGSLLLIALATVGGLLTKGPVVLLHLLGPAVAAACWRPRPWRWLGGWMLPLTGALLAGVLLAGLWAVPAALHGGPAFRAAILWDQTAGRMVHSFAHARPWWTYLVFLPVLLLPWVVCTPLWSAAVRLRRDPAAVFGAVWLLVGFITLSLVSGKQPHYALPLLPPACLLAARALSLAGAGGFAARVPVIAAATTGAVLALGTGLVFVKGPAFDLRAPAAAVAVLQSDGAAVAVLGRYQGQLTFPGRLGAPLTQIQGADARAWTEAHPGGVLVSFGSDPPEDLPAALLGRYPYRSGTLGIWRVLPPQLHAGG